MLYDMLMQPGMVNPQVDAESDARRQLFEAMQQASAARPAPTPIEHEKMGKGEIAGSILSALGAALSARAGDSPLPGLAAVELIQRRRRERGERKASDKDAVNLADWESKRGKSMAQAQMLKMQLDEGREGRRRNDMLRILRERGVALDPQTEAIFLATGDIDRPKPVDELGELGKAADLGSKGVVDQVPEKYRPAAAAARSTSEKKGNKEDKGQFAGFNTQAELASAIARETDDEMRASNVETLVDVPFDDPLTGLQSVRKQVVMKPSISISEARRRALARFPGAEKHLSGYGSEPPAGPKKQGVSADSVMQKIRSRNASKR